jgi:16S rRNA A1518/A1519 N6-dimethyltransferase RsmA/KsgA/DIM1 with predicted DNA glycosylase/AP lyase activity
MDKRDLALSFADDPELYDLVRVGYPDELFKCLLDKVQIKEHHRVLEIGPGSGKLTQHLLNLGNQVVGLEPAEAFVKFLKGKFKEKKSINIGFVLHN